MNGVNVNSTVSRTQSGASSVSPEKSPLNPMATDATDSTKLMATKIRSWVAVTYGTAKTAGNRLASTMMGHENVAMADAHNATPQLATDKNSSAAPRSPRARGHNPATMVIPPNATMTATAHSQLLSTAVNRISTTKTTETAVVAASSRMKVRSRCALRSTATGVVTIPTAQPGTSARLSPGG